MNHTNVKPSKMQTSALCGFVINGKVIGFDKMDKLDTIKYTKSKITVITTLGMIPAERIILAKLDEITNDSIRFASGSIALKVRKLGLKDLAIVPPGTDQDVIFQTVQGLKMALYSFDKFKQKKSPKINLTILGPNSHIDSTEKIADGVTFTKDLANMPPNECTPDTLGNMAKKMCVGTKLSCTVLKKSELKKFGGIYAVGKGSKNEPRLIILEYKGGKGKPTLLVGKAVTFDTGGISLKPGDKMDEMKFDKCGGCTVLGIMKTIESLKLPVNVVGIVPSVENMPSGESYRPGDIIKLYSGKTAEILNTDAEGRLILADALSYGEEHYSPKEIIDFATLTGACIIALGANVAGMTSNNSKLAENIKEASNRTGEEIWQLPLNDDYMDMIKSDVADMRNMGIGKVAGTITAAAFLRNAIKDTPWVHLDIAGVAWTQTGTKKKPYNPKGATGFGVRLIVDHLS